MHAPGRPDWRQVGDYRWLLDSDAALHAWEWLRRRDEYRRAAAEGREGASRTFGLVRFADPACAAPHARPWWHRDADPAVLQALCVISDEMDVARLLDNPDVEVATFGHEEQILVHDGQHQLRIDIVGGTVSQRRGALEWRISGLARVRPALDALDRLIAFAEQRVLRPSPHPSRALARRWMTLLRVRDALDAKASQQAIAAVLYGRALMGARWRVDGASVRSRVQRLVRASKTLALRDPIEMLDPASYRSDRRAS